MVHMDAQNVPKPFGSSRTHYSSLLTSNSIIYTYTAKLSLEEHESIKNALGYLSSTKDIRLHLMTTHSLDSLGLNSLSLFVNTDIWPKFWGFNNEGMTEFPARWKEGCYGGIYSFDVIEAIDNAIMDEVNIPSLSILSLAPLYDDSLSIATFGAMSKGVFVSMAVMNFGPFLGILSSTFIVVIIIDWMAAMIQFGCILFNKAAASATCGATIDVPFITLNANGKIILDYVNSSDLPTTTLHFKYTCYNCKQAPKVASYSSTGPSLSYPTILKPNLMASSDSILGSQQDRTSVNRLVFYNRTNNFNIATPTPLLMGADFLNPNEALDPSLSYNAHKEDYINFLWTLNLTLNQIHAIVRSPYSCLNSSLDLNYSTSVAYFDSGNKTNSVKFQQRLTNVGKRKVKLLCKISTTMKEVTITVVSDILIFGYKNDKQTYKVKIKGPSLRQDNVVDNSINWVEMGAITISRVQLL
ncbi:Cucumisin [Handroanthus impetiginosus]|uniref:Cucumisin n=1 Tax=Handroanthus impetiginosus TaxID=429701 RepID=A0A2G9G744_9LAMI|nr:Cucumisin [Handroanthus impetiginosus]